MSKESSRRSSQSNSRIQLAVVLVSVAAVADGCGTHAAKAGKPLMVQPGESRTVKLSEVPLSRLDRSQPLRHLIGCRRGSETSYLAVPGEYSKSRPLRSSIGGSFTLKLTVRNGQVVVSCSRQGS